MSPKLRKARKDGDWYSVRCVFEVSRDGGTRTYEERITLWRAASFEDAIARAEAEAAQYATAHGAGSTRYLQLAQAFRLSDEPGDGAEVFSLMRDSPLKPTAYLDAYFDSGTERDTPA